MAAFVAIQSFNTVGPDGGTVTVPLGARVEEGDFFYNAYPEAFEPEGAQPFFGRINPANGQVETTQRAPEPETKTEPAPPAPEEPAAVTEPEPAPKAGPRSSAGRRKL